MADDSAARTVLLHGDLNLWIHEARRLPNMDLFTENLRRCFAPCTTLVILNSQNPKWDAHFNLPVAHYADKIRFLVKDDDIFGAQLIGTVSVPASRVAAGAIDHEWFPIIGSKGKPPKPGCTLLVSVKLSPVWANQEYQHGIAGDPEKRGVQGNYFPLRKGGMVKLYQDAHVREGELPEIRLEDVMVFEHDKCWEDIYHAIIRAHHLIYIVGWSIYCKLRLVREPTHPLPITGELILGELLNYKSQEGVRVCLLTWDDKTSHDKFIIRTVFPP